LLPHEMMYEAVPNAMAEMACHDFPHLA